MATTLEQLDSRVTAIEKRLNGLSAVLRQHFGDAFKSGYTRVGAVILVALIMVGAFCFSHKAPAASYVPNNWYDPKGYLINSFQSSYSTNGNCAFFFNGTNYTLTVDQIVAAGVTNLASAMIGNLPTATMTNNFTNAVNAVHLGRTQTYTNVNWGSYTGNVSFVNGLLQ